MQDYNNMDEDWPFFAILFRVKEYKENGILKEGKKQNKVEHHLFQIIILIKCSYSKMN